MARASKNYVLLLQPKNGGEKALQLEITPLKAQKVLEMIRRELTRKEVKESQRYSSVSLEPFFVDAVVDTPGLLSETAY